MSQRNEITAKVVSIQAAGSIGDITDINANNLEDGGMIKYDLESLQYVITSELKDSALTVSGGDYATDKGTTLTITTSTVSTDPTSLANGELAYNSVGDKLLIGTTGSPVAIGGGSYMSLIDHTAGVNTADSAMIVDTNKHIDEINTASFSIDTSGGTVAPITSLATSITSSSADTELPTSLAVENRIQEVHNADTHKTLANNSGSIRNLSDVITTHGNGNTLILDDVQLGDGIKLDSSDLGLEYTIVNISNEQLLISPDASGSLSFAGGNGTVPLGGRVLASGGVASVLRTTVAGNPHWVIFGNGIS